MRTIGSRRRHAGTAVTELFLSLAVVFCTARGLEAQPQLSLSVGVNQPTFSVGETLILSVEASNPGLPGAADFYIGLLSVSGGLWFFTDTTGGIVQASDWWWPWPSPPIAEGVDLSVPFSVAFPNFFVHELSDSDVSDCGFVFFLVAVKAGAWWQTAENALAFATTEFRLLMPPCPSP